MLNGEFYLKNLISSYRILSNDLTKASSALIARIASQFMISETIGNANIIRNPSVTVSGSFISQK